jgi:hypothetical protein
MTDFVKAPSYYLKSRVCGVIGNFAKVASLSKSDESRLSPSGTPRVTDFPVRRSRVTSTLDTVIDLVVAMAQDTTRV